MNYLVQCDNCNHPHYIEIAAGIALDRGIQWACPVCKLVMNRSTQVFHDPRASIEQKELAAILFTAALTIGIVLLVEKLGKKLK